MVKINPKYIPYSKDETQAILEHAEASLPLADTAVQPFGTKEEDSGKTGTLETIGGKPIAPSTKAYEVKHGYSIKNICLSSNHSTYIIGVNGSTKTILKESEWGEVVWTNDTGETVTVKVGCENTGDDYIAMITSIGINDAVEELDAKIGAKYTKPGTGIPKGDLAETLQKILNGVSTIDTTPTEDSENPVQSGGVFAAIEGRVSVGAVVGEVDDSDSSE